MENRKKKLSEVETLVAVICQNVPKYTRKTNNDLKLHALVTKQKKRQSEKCLLVIQKRALEKIAKPQILGFLTFIK